MSLSLVYGMVSDARHFMKRSWMVHFARFTGAEVIGYIGRKEVSMSRCKVFVSSCRGLEGMIDLLDISSRIRSKLMLLTRGNGSTLLYSK